MAYTKVSGSGSMAGRHLQPCLGGGVIYLGNIGETEQQFRKDRSKVRASLVSFTLLITVISSLGLGVLLAHATIHWILRIFAPVARDTSESTSVLIAQEAAEQG